jgi:hypothetical protein
MGRKVAQPAGKETANLQPQQTAVAEGQKPKLQGREAALLNLQRTHGNRHVKQMLKGGILQRQCSACGQEIAGGECMKCGKTKGRLQRKLRIGASNDPLELEADRVANQVMAASARPAVSSTPPRIQRFMGQTVGQVDLEAPASVDRVLSSPGSPLEPALKQDMEQRFGQDFSQVRVHTDAAAGRSAREVNADAYTVAHNIVFREGHFVPETYRGRRLVAHELTHVVQQGGISGGLVQRDSTHKGKQEQDEQTYDTVLTKAFRAADSKQWEVAARLANGLSKYEMGVFLSQYKDPELISYLHKGALNAAGVGDKSAIALATEATYKMVKQKEDLRYRRELAKQNGTAPPNEDGSPAVSAPPKVAVQPDAVAQMDSSLGKQAFNVAIGVVTSNLPGGGLSTRLMSAAMYGFGAEIYHQFADDKQTGRFNSALTELAIPANAADFVTSYISGAMAGLVSPVTDLLGLAALAEQMPMIAANLAKNTWEKKSELIKEAHDIGNKITELKGKMLGQFAQLRQNPSEIFAMLDSMEERAIAAAGEAGGGTAKKVVAYFSGKDEEPVEGEPTTPQESLTDALLNTKPEEKAGLFNFVTSKFTRARKAVFKAPWQKIGYNIGYALGAILVNVLLLAATEGIGNLIVEVSAGLGKLSPLLAGVEKALVGIGTRIAGIEKAIATLLGTLLKPLSKATKWMEPLLKPLEDLMAKLGGFVRKLLGLSEKAAAEATAQVGVHLADEAAEKFGSKVSPKAPAIADTAPPVRQATTPSKALATDSKASGSLIHDRQKPPTAINPAEKPHSSSIETRPVNKPQADLLVPKEPPITKLEADAVKIVEEHPNVIHGETPGKRHASVTVKGEPHEIIEVLEPSGIGCELHSPTPYIKIPCPKGMGGAKDTIENIKPHGGETEVPRVKSAQEAEAKPKPKTEAKPEDERLSSLQNDMAGKRKELQDLRVKKRELEERIAKEHNARVDYSNQSIKTKDPNLQNEFKQKQKEAQARWEAAVAEKNKLPTEGELKKDVDRLQNQVDNIQGKKTFERHSYSDSGKLEPCFSPGTLVKTPQGDRPIETLKAGDMILAYDFKMEQVVSAIVLKLHTNWTTHLVDLKLGDEIISATRMHPFWENLTQNWIAARLLLQGMQLRTIQGANETVIFAKTYSMQSPTYNLEVSELHNFFVGTTGVLVHNGTGSGFESTKRVFTEIYAVYDASGNIVYVGKTVQGKDVRFGQHNVAKSHWEAKGYKMGETPLKSGHLTAYETAVWEQHYIDKYGGARSVNRKSSLENDIRAITEDNYKEFKDMHNPCA